MKLLPKQENAIYYLKDLETEELIYGGAAGGGKSKLGVLWLIECCKVYPGTRWIMGRSKLKSLKETTLNTFFETTTELKINSEFTYNQSTNVIKWYNGSEILLKDLFLYPSDPEFDSLGSLEITGAFVDECSQVSFKAWQILKSRIRYKLNEYNLIPKILGTCNPSKNWTYTEFYNPTVQGTLRESKKFIQALPKDNPFLPESYINTLLGLDQASKKRLHDGDWNFDDNPYALFEYSNILGMFTNEFIKPTNENYMTCDIAYTGSDVFVIGVWSALVLKKIIAIDKIDDVLVSKKIHELRLEYRVPIKNVIYDADGLQTFTRNATRNGNLVGAVNFHNGGKPIYIQNQDEKNTENFKNLKAQCYYYLSEAVKDNTIYIQDQTYRKQIIEELEQINRLPFDDERSYQLEKKDEIRVRLGRSPDFADMIMMRMYFELTPKSQGIKRLN